MTTYENNPFAASSLGGLAASNPFAAPVNPFTATAVVDVDPNAPSSAYTYALVRSGPDVSPEEVEVAHVASIEVMTVWGSNVLRVDHLTPPRSYFVGEELGDATTTCDFFIASEMLGASRAPIVVADGANASLVILPRSRGTVDFPGHGVVTLAELIASGQARPSSHLAGAHELALPAGAKARMELEESGLVFEVNAVNAGKPQAAGMFSQLDVTAYAYFALSLVLHFGIVASLAFFMPHMGDDDAEALDRDAMLMMQHMLNASAEREEENKPTEAITDSAPGGASGAQAQGASGAMGSTVSTDTGKRAAFRGPPDNPDRHLAHETASEMKAVAEHFGLVNILSSMGDPGAVTATWGREEAAGADPMNAQGSMWGDALGESAGNGGLGLSGGGLGGGGNAEGIGVGRIGTIGGGTGGIGGGSGNGHGHLGGQHIPRPPSMVQGETQVNGRMPREVIQRIVRQNFGRFRLCYEDGLRTDPSLAGRVVVKFAIDRSGAVAMAQDGGSAMSNANVVSCVVRGFSNLSFPEPAGGVVTVEYPIAFAPGGD